jgi:hypothetical protein
LHLTESNQEIVVPYRYEIDPVNKVLRAVFEGALTDDVLREYYHTAPGVVASVQAVTFIADFSAVTSEEITSNVIRELAHSPPLIRDPTPRAVIALSDYVYGMVRMFQMLGEKREMLYVVRSMSEAREVLGLPELHFVPLPETRKRSA